MIYVLLHLDVPAILAESDLSSLLNVVVIAHLLGILLVGILGTILTFFASLNVRNKHDAIVYWAFMGSTLVGIIVGYWPALTLLFLCIPGVLIYRLVLSVKVFRAFPLSTQKLHE